MNWQSTKEKQILLDTGAAHWGRAGYHMLKGRQRQEVKTPERETNCKVSKIK